MPITLNTKVYAFSGWLQGRIAQYFNRDSGTPNGFLGLTGTVDQPANGSATFKVRWKLKLPTVVDGDSCACPDGSVRENFADIVVTINKHANTAERTDLAQQLDDLTSTPEFRDSVISLVSPHNAA